MPNGIDLILADHRRVEALFEQALSDRFGGSIGEIIDALTAHDDAEHAALYPLVGVVIGDVAMVERAASAHSEVKKQIDVIKHLEGEPLLAAVQVLQRLVDAGNTVLVIEHNLDVIKTADWIIDLGPEGGAAGGQIVAAGTPEQVAQVEGSHTGAFLRKVL